MATGLQPGNRRHRHDHMVLQTRLSGKEPACHGTCKKYKAWAAAVKAEKAYTKDMVSRDRVNRSDYVKEGWMAHKGQRRRKR